MGRTFRCYDTDTGESELEMYEVPEGVSLGVWGRDDTEGGTIIISPAKALEMAAWLAARPGARPPWWWPFAVLVLLASGLLFYLLLTSGT